VPVTALSSGVDPEIRFEQDYLDRSRTDLAAMRERAQLLLDDLIAAGNPDLDYQAALVHRVRVLEDSPRPLLFGRIDEGDGTSWHIGRRHVEDAAADPVVIDWRAPVSVPFYRARPGQDMGLQRRRQIMVDRNQVLSVADDLFGEQTDEAGTTRLRGGDALLAELERARTGEMLDIVATIQAEQDEIIRAPLSELLAVQGGPGTGKTAVGLHRAAFLIYNHPSLTRDGVLVLGPSRAFLRYIAQVLPSLGEEAVVQTTIADIAPKAKWRGRDEMPVRTIKGDARMAQVLQRALDGRRRRAEHDVSIGVRFGRATVPKEHINAVIDAITARPAPYKAGRTALRSRLVSEVRRTFRDAGKNGADEPWFEKELTAGAEFKTLLDHLWPSVSPVALVRELLASKAQLARYGAGILHEDECSLLLKPSSTGWTSDDLPLLDEAAFLTGGRTRSFGHVIVDEAQDLTPMQFRMVARRAPSGSMTILGDLAQATGPATYDSWDEILAHLPAPTAGRLRTPFPVRREELTLGYRAPGKVLDLASRLLPLAAPAVAPTSSIRAGRSEPLVIGTTAPNLVDDALAEALRLSTEYGLVALVAPVDAVPDLVAAAAAAPAVGLLENDGMTKPVTIVPAPEAKGLEFDAVVVMEPAAIAGSGDDRRGLRLLYVAMTRPIQHLSIVHAQPLPAPLV
jgi:DNA helicase IV